MKFLSLILVLYSVTLHASDELPRLKEFRTDGCSWSPDGTLLNPNKYTDCCKLHDYEYWLGGTSFQRQEADLQFRQCLVDAGASKAIGELYYTAVRQFGGPRDCDYCWGYGWEPQATEYKALNELQLRQVPEMTKEDILNTPVKLRRRGE